VRIIMNKVPKEYLKQYARDLRKEGTKGEAILWKYVLRARKVHGYQFNRQFIMGDFIVDFISRKLGLVIEVDDSSHIPKGKLDRDKQTYLEKKGYRVLRFTEAEILCRLDDVAQEIYYAAECLMQDKNPPS